MIRFIIHSGLFYLPPTGYMNSNYDQSIVLIKLVPNCRLIKVRDLLIM
jgi:hypothetical protein